MKASKYILLFASVLFFSTVASAQLIGKKKDKETPIDTDGKVAFDKGVQETREAARLKLKPYKYDATKSTYFSYKSYDYAKEVEVITLEKTDYKLFFDGAMVKNEKIKIEIYDKPKTGKGRILLDSYENVGGNTIEVSLDDLNETFKVKKKEMLSEDKHALVDKMRLKKIYINYVIPAVDRELHTETDEMGNEIKTTVINYSAMVLAVGYLNM